uniref:Ribonuclease H-like domain, reverse transcriptase, RNA-dependent DNA polymerase n=1 Tax=Tanacetum cinerariifolium TaxID=118510 RepID=A0A6L2KDC0_TANCI|nr:ribonuclease H-like domain, reverse transcriptase, RNA-dependent DNA polymerase [Tanacetum cinerariifolium]
MLHMKEDKTIDTFTEKLTTLVNNASSLGHTMEDETLVRKLLNTVPDRYLQIVASIEQYSDLSEMTLEEAIGRLKTYEEKIKYKKGKQVNNQEKLMFTRHENKGKYFRGRGRRKHKFSQERNHENPKEGRKDGETSHKNYNRNNSKKSNYDTRKLQCYKCKKIGHIAPKCPQRTKPNEQSNLVEEDLEPTLLMAILKDEEQNISLHEENGSKAYRLFDPTTHRICVSRDVKFKENETWDWKDYMSEHINDEPEWTDFKIGNLEVINERHQEIQPIEENNEFPNNDDNYASPTRDSPSHSHTPHTPSTRSSEELLLAKNKPMNYKEASSDQKWIEVMKVELDSINRNNTWELTTLPKGHKAIGLKWVFKTKKDADGNIIKHKARLVAKGYIQEHGIDFEEVFAPVARMETIRLFLAIAANNKWEVHHLDVKSAFLHGDLKEEVYVTQPEGFIKRQDKGKVYRLIKALYGLRQAPRAWNIKLDNTLKSLDFKKCVLEQAIYTKTSKDSTLLIGVYVDDLIITGTQKKEIDKFKAQMEEKFKMSDLGLLAYYLGIEVTQTNSDISIRQSAYANKIKKEARIDSSYGVNTQEEKGTTDIIFYYGESPISWSTQKQATVALSSCESEFIAVTATATQALWLKKLLSKLTYSEEDKVTIRVDNKSAIALMKKPVFHGRSKHIDTKYHFIRECVEREDIQVEFVSEEYQKADILTKAISKINFLTMRQLVGLKDLRHSICD